MPCADQRVWAQQPVLPPFIPKLFLMQTPHLRRLQSRADPKSMGRLPKNITFSPNAATGSGGVGPICSTACCLRKARKNGHISVKHHHILILEVFFHVARKAPHVCNLVGTTFHSNVITGVSVGRNSRAPCSRLGASTLSSSPWKVYRAAHQLPW
ncbi:unnamed protein product [Trypanosoma congolense IL3000]|uniref:WGS project CAEQ00000000 data, annotated contig 1745 n=1 Tax=Trypanosoma congolense (strain IL3000) TaxID=1068625 RepID=F9W8L4_TRYCI|nr:unnamed protein product [Trypanosoma congolense IL3000]